MYNFHYLLYSVKSLLFEQYHRNSGFLLPFAEQNCRFSKCSKKTRKKKTTTSKKGELLKVVFSHSHPLTMDSNLLSSTADATARLLASSRREPSSSTGQTSTSTTSNSTTTRTRVPPSLAASTSSLAASTSLYSSTASLRPRHSLYGTEDRVVLDLGSRIWKFGFSGEAKPRACKSVLRMIGEEHSDTKGMIGKSLGLWGLEKGEVGDLEWEIREQRLKKGLRDVWFK